MSALAEESLRVLRDPAQVARILSPLRRRLLESLAEPDSAAGLARRLGLARQKVNYHLRALEKEGLLELVMERKRRGCVERCLRVTSRALIVDPRLFGVIEDQEELPGHELSSAYQVQSAARVVRDVGLLRERASAAGERLLTQTLRTEIAFSSPGEIDEFQRELAGAIAGLAAKYDRSGAEEARAYALTAIFHPVVTTSETKDE